MSVLPGFEIEVRLLFQNPISNAMKISPDNSAPVLCLGAEDEGEHWNFRLADKVTGIESRCFDKNFGKFQPLSPRKEFEGTGIGLSFARQSSNCMAEKSARIRSRARAAGFTLPSKKQRDKSLS